MTHSSAVERLTVNQDVAGSIPAVPVQLEKIVIWVGMHSGESKGL